VTDAAGDRIELAYGEAEGQGGGIGSDTRYPGLLNRIQYPTFLRTIDYDVRDRPTAVIDHLSDSERQIARTAYDAVGNRIASTDALGRITRYRYDALDRLVERIDPAGHFTTFSYDDRDNLRSVTDPNGHTTQYQYDRADRQIAEIRPGGQTWSYQYDPAGRLIARTDPDGRRTERAYTSAGLLIEQRHYLSGKTEPERTVSFGYDDNGNLTHWSDGSANARYRYDKEDRLLGETTEYGPFSLSHAYSYDAAGNKHRYTGPDGVTITYHHEHDQLARIELPGQGSITFNRYHWTRPERITYPGGAHHSFGYDPLMRLSHIQVQDPAELTVMDHRYQYDAVGNITHKSTERGDYRYQYDRLDRLVLAEGPDETEGWAYDPNGNRIQDALHPGAWSYDANDRLTESPLGRDRYNAAGNTIERTRQGQRYRLIYNAEGRLARVEDVEGHRLATYRYDPFGRRLSKTTPTQTRYFHYTDEGLAGEYNASGSAVRQYGYRPDAPWGTHPLFQKSALGYAFYQSDQLGTPQRLLTPNGATVWQARYRAFGELVTQSGSWSNPLRFPGQREDAETGLYQNYLRDYDPTIGRYAQADPLGLRGGLNGYGYALNNPLYWTDPTGECPPCAWALAWAARAFMSCATECMIGAGVGGAIGYLYDYVRGCELSSPGWGTVAGAVSGCALGCLNPLEWFDRGKKVSVAGGKLKSFKGGQTREQRLHDLVDDPKVSSADRGWIRQEMNEVARGKKRHLRNPPGRQLAHERGRESAKGWGYEHSHLQNRKDHMTQHKFDNWGRSNNERF
jgi:RHS repeat-associated protein